MKSDKRQKEGSDEGKFGRKKQKLEPWEAVFGPKHDVFKQEKPKIDSKTEIKEENEEKILREFFKTVQNRLKGKSVGDKNKNEALAKAILDEAVDKSAVFSSDSGVDRLNGVISLAADHDLPNIMKLLTSDLQLACTQQHTSNLIFTLLGRVLEYFSKQVPDEDSKGTSKQSKNVKTEFEEWILTLSSFLINNFEELMRNWCAGHIYRMILQVLSGFNIKSKVNETRNRQNLKAWFCDPDSINKVSKVYDAPQSFDEVFDKIFDRIVSDEHIEDLVFNTESMPSMLTLVLIVSQIKGDKLKRLVQSVLSFTKPERDLPIVDYILNEQGTYVIQKLLLTCDDKQISRLWKKNFRGKLECLVLHPNGSFLVQHLLESCRSSKQLEEMFSELCPVMDGIIGLDGYDVIAKMADACFRLTSCQDEFGTALKNAMHLEEDGEELLVPLIVSQQRRELFWMVHEYNGPNRGEYDQLLCGKRMKNPLEIKEYGTQILKSMVQFQKPKKIMKSAVSLDRKMLEEMARHTFGYDFLEACFNSPTVNNKLKQKLIFHMKEKYHILAKHERGSRILRTMWNHSSLRLRKIICEELVANESVKSSIMGNEIFRTFKVKEFVKFRGKWEQDQMKTAAKDKLTFDDDDEDNKVLKSETEAAE